jgi:hypothetical protein
LVFGKSDKIKRHQAEHYEFTTKNLSFLTKNQKLKTKNNFLRDNKDGTTTESSPHGVLVSGPALGTRSHPVPV